MGCGGERTTRCAAPDDRELRCGAPGPRRRTASTCAAAWARSPAAPFLRRAGRQPRRRQPTRQASSPGATEHVVT
eukprot:1301195-Prymnesium_polylepis.3